MKGKIKTKLPEMPEVKLPEINRFPDFGNLLINVFIC